MSTNTKTRLEWLLDQLVQLDNGGNIRYEGLSRFYGARDELQDIINTYEDSAPILPAPVLEVMGPDQVDQVVQRVRDEIAKSDAEVMAAIVQTGQDTVAALKPAQ